MTQTELLVRAHEADTHTPMSVMPGLVFAMLQGLRFARTVLAYDDPAKVPDCCWRTAQSMFERIEAEFPTSETRP